jgi:ketosteroid isomerase-like protein
MASKTELVLTAIAAVRAQDLERARPLVHDDVVWHIPGTSSISGDVTGVEAWSEKLQRLLGAGLHPQLLGVLEGDDHVAAVQRNTAEANGASLDVQVVNLFTVRDGRVARLDTFFGDQVAAEAFWNVALT